MRIGAAAVIAGRLSKETDGCANRESGPRRGESKVSKRTFVIGDIHGCHAELMTLLGKCGRTAMEEVICVGDLVDRGPEPAEVVRFFMEDGNARSLMGNHEDKHIRMRQGELDGSASQAICRVQLAGEYGKAVDYFETMPLYLERMGCIIVHAGMVPGLPVKKQPRQALLRGRMPWMKSSYDKAGEPWWSRYEGRQPVIYGHSYHRRPHVENGTYGIDTGCCHGGFLTALVLPEMRIVQVPARKDHWKSVRAAHTETVESWRKRAWRPDKPHRPKPQS
jgi:serine/threonine protein phosphatase 1